MNLQTELRHFAAAILATLMLLAGLIQLLDFRMVNGLIAVHVILGSLAFIIGGLALFARKGQRLHRATGQTFYVLMTLSCVITLVVATMPNHQSFSMFQISVMSLYFLIGGKHSLQFRLPSHELLLDKLLAVTVIIVSGYVFLYAVITEGVFYPLRTVFGLLGMTFGVVDLWLFRVPTTPRKYWLALHLSKMTAGYTTAVTGFFVAQKILGGYYDWFSPTVICLAFIGYWLVKLKVFQSPKQCSSHLANSSPTV